jgi:RNA polymerase sigma factor (sigma-70 family)
MVSASEARPRRSESSSFHVVQDAYQRYGPALLRKAERILQSPDDAGDIVHALFVDLMQGRDPKLDIKYLYRAVGNRCINFLRDRGNRERLLEHQQHALRGPARTPCEDEVIGLDLLAKLAGILDSRCLEILICRFWDDMTQDEIAAFLGTSRKTVGKRLIKIRAHAIALRGEASRHEPEDQPMRGSKDA